MMNGRMGMMQKLNLSDDQLTQIKKIHMDFQRKQIQNEAKIRLARLDLSQMIQADKPDRSAIEKSIRDISSIETDTKLARVDQLLAIKNVLTPDQVKTFKQMMMNRGGMMRGRMMMMRRGRPGMFGESFDSAPGEGLPDMAAMPEPMDQPEGAMLDEMDLSDIATE